MRFLWVTVFAALFAAGCQHRPSANAKGSDAVRSGRAVPARGQTTVVPATDVIGKVISVNPSLRFVVIDVSFGQPPRVEQRLSVYRQGQKVGDVKVSPHARDSFVAADIVAGEARVGDEVRAF